LCQARRELANCLKEMTIRGEISNSVSYLIFILECEAWRDNKITTQWLDEYDLFVLILFYLCCYNFILFYIYFILFYSSFVFRLIEQNVQPTKPDEWLVILCGALFKAYNLNAERYTRYLNYLGRKFLAGKTQTKN
jgi:hypothetical protein